MHRFFHIDCQLSETADICYTSQVTKSVGLNTTIVLHKSLNGYCKVAVKEDCFCNAAQYSYNVISSSFDCLGDFEKDPFASGRFIASEDLSTRTSSVSTVDMAY